MTLACIGYGSLIWSPRNLAPHLKHPDHWFGDGPALPVEFARESDRRRITLIIVPGHPASTTCWTPFRDNNLNAIHRTKSGGDRHPPDLSPENFNSPETQYLLAAGHARQLADREGCDIEHIGLMTASGRTESALPPALLEILKMWMESKHLSGVVWTELPCGFKMSPGHLPTVNEVCAYLEGLIERGEHANAEEYIRRAPPQIITPYRRAIEQRFGWTPL